MFKDAIKELLSKLQPESLVELNKEITNMIKPEGSVIHLPLGINEFTSVIVRDITHISGLKKGHSGINMIDGQEYICRYTFDEFREYMDNNHTNFRSLHQDLLVNMDMIKSYHSYNPDVLMASGACLRISGTAMSNIIQKQLNHLEDLYVKPDYEYAPLRWGRSKSKPVTD